MPAPGLWTYMSLPGRRLRLMRRDRGFAFAALDHLAVYAPIDALLAGHSEPLQVRGYTDELSCSEPES